MKSNKSDFIILKNELDQCYISIDNFEILNDKFDNFQVIFNKEKEDRDNEFQEFKVSQADFFDVSMHELCKKRFQKYERVERQFSQFFDVNDLAVRFERKADLEMIYNLQNEKANEADLKEIQSAIGNLNEKLKQIAVI